MAEDIEFNCSECGGGIAVDSSASGLTVNCPHCEKPIRIPLATYATPAHGFPFVVAVPDHQETTPVPDGLARKEGSWISAEEVQSRFENMMKQRREKATTVETSTEGATSGTMTWQDEYRNLRREFKRGKLTLGEIESLLTRAIVLKRKMGTQVNWYILADEIFGRADRKSSVNTAPSWSWIKTVYNPTTESPEDLIFMLTSPRTATFQSVSGERIAIDW